MILKMCCQIWIPKIASSIFSISEALKKLLEFAFTENNVYRVTTGCLAENKGSERVMQKNGLIKEAEHIDYEWHDGKMKTRLEYRLLRTEWERVR